MSAPVGAQALPDLSRLCLHTITTKPWGLEEAVRRYGEAGVAGITVWRDTFEGMGARRAARLIAEAGLRVVSLCRGGFFAAPDDAGRRRAIEENRRILEEAQALGAPHVVMVCGAFPGQELEESRSQIRAGFEALLPHAQSAGVRLAIEPLHPMYADSRSAINTLRQANDLAEALDTPWVGVAVDVYHVWWDPELASEVARCGGLGKLLAFHICDWRTPTEDLLYDRGIMGEGCIPLRRIRGWVEQAGFGGFNEVEIFSRRYWAEDQGQFLERILAAYRRHA